MGVLRAALWSQSRKKPPERRVPWTAFGVDIDFIFTGGIILIANAPMEDKPELRALKTRITPLQLVATFEEIAALMRSVSLDGYEYGEAYASPRECMEVTEYIIDCMRGLRRSLDMRVWVNSMKDYLQHKAGHSVTDWEDLIDTRLRESTVVSEGRSEKVQREIAIALEIAGRDDLSQGMKLLLWAERTGKTRRTYFRALERAQKYR